jgi:hypothetical protein
MLMFLVENIRQYLYEVSRLKLTFRNYSRYRDKSEISEYLTDIKDTSNVQALGQYSSLLNVMATSQIYIAPKVCAFV